MRPKRLDRTSAKEDVYKRQVIFECTLGFCPGDDRMFGHTGIPMIEIMLETMRAQHGPADDARYYTSHMARTLHGSHAELERQLAHLDVTPAYDGMMITCLLYTSRCV